MKNYYAILGFKRIDLTQPQAMLELEIKRAYRQLSLLWHPDINKSSGASEKFRVITEAYRFLLDPQKRKTINDYLLAHPEGVVDNSGSQDLYLYCDNNNSSFSDAPLSDSRELVSANNSGINFTTLIEQAKFSNEHLLQLAETNTKLGFALFNNSEFFERFNKQQQAELLLILFYMESNPRVEKQIRNLMTKDYRHFCNALLVRPTIGIAFCEDYPKCVNFLSMEDFYFIAFHNSAFINFLVCHPDYGKLSVQNFLALDKKICLCYDNF